PAYAERELLTGDWVEAKQMAVVPAEEYLFSTLPDKPNDHTLSRDDKTRVDMHVWAEEVRVNPDAKRKEPVGDWMIAEKLEAKRGEYIGYKKRLELPLWDMGQNLFMLPEKPRRFRPGIDNPPGVDVDLGTRHLLVDFEGGRGNFSFGPRSGKSQVTDESGI